MQFVRLKASDFFSHQKPINDSHDLDNILVKIM